MIPRPPASTRTYTPVPSTTRFRSGPVTGAEVAAAIGPGLAKAALAVKVDGQLRDLKRPIARDAAVEIVTASHADSLELLRHDCAHILARSEEHTSELQSLMRISYAVFCLQKTKKKPNDMIQ